jgi:hypothetical protein
MKNAVISFSYDSNLCVPVAKLSAVLALLNECGQVEHRYLDGEGRWYAKEAPRVSVDLIDYQPGAKPAPKPESDTAE